MTTDTAAEPDGEALDVERLRVAMMLAHDEIAAVDRLSLAIDEPALIAAKYDEMTRDAAAPALTAGERHAANVILDRPYADPDDDAALVARAALRLAAAREAPAAAEPGDEWTWKGDSFPGDRHGAADGWVHTHVDGSRWAHPEKVCDAGER